MPREFRRLPAMRAGPRGSLPQWLGARGGGSQNGSGSGGNGGGSGSKGGTGGWGKNRMLATTTTTTTFTTAASATSSVTSSASPTGNAGPQSLPSGAIAGIVIVAVLLIATVVVFLVRRRLIAKRMKRRSSWAPWNSGRSFMYGPGFGATFARDIRSPQHYRPPAPLPPALLRSYSTKSRGSGGMIWSSGGFSIAPVPNVNVAHTPNPGSATARCTFIATMPDELPISVGEVVRVLRSYDDGWALCMNGRRERGMVPLECLDHGLGPEQNIQERSGTGRTSSLSASDLGRLH